MFDSGVGERPLRVNPVIAIRHGVPNGVKASDTTAVAPAAAHADGERLVVAVSLIQDPSPIVNIRPSISLTTLINGRGALAGQFRPSGGWASPASPISVRP
jgi:hypothetical protein